jgi:shikimate kinase
MTESSGMQVILRGPQGCGKTRWGAVLASMFEAAGIAVEVVEEQTAEEEVAWVQAVIGWANTREKPFTLAECLSAVEAPRDVTTREAGAVLASQGFKVELVRRPYVHGAVREWSRA